ncbi:hypothetical protein B0H11DRAFT_2235485 [Mycena galericulata]|nr:hypothetical protein B0H11DRAFT_2235485 [Mycena galericulata]
MELRIAAPHLLLAFPSSDQASPSVGECLFGRTCNFRVREPPPTSTSKLASNPVRYLPRARISEDSPVVVSPTEGLTSKPQRDRRPIFPPEHLDESMAPPPPQSPAIGVTEERDAYILPAYELPLQRAAQCAPSPSSSSLRRPSSLLRRPNAGSARERRPGGAEAARRMYVDSGAPRPLRSLAQDRGLPCVESSGGRGRHAEYI